MKTHELRSLLSTRVKKIFFLLALTSFTIHVCLPQRAAAHRAANRQSSSPQPAIPAILQLFETFEVVGLPAAHGQKDLDDLLLALIRDPRFPTRVNDIVVECGNVRYQPVLDRYIAGGEVSFGEVQHVWRDTTVQQMCGSSGFYEMLFPLVRAINLQLPLARRLRIVAADPPIEWSQIHSYDDLRPFFDRDGSIADVMEREVLSKHRKALMLFGIFHLVHGGGPGEGDAVTRYERHYPGRTFIIGGDLGDFDIRKTGSPNQRSAGGIGPFLLRTRNSKLGTMSLDSFLQSPLHTDAACNVSAAFASTPAKPLADQIDAFLYLGPIKFQLAEPLPADIAFDRSYRAEWLRRMKVVGLPGPSTLEETDAEVLARAADVILPPPSRTVVSGETMLRLRQDCLSRRHQD